MDVGASLALADARYRAQLDALALSSSSEMDDHTLDIQFERGGETFYLEVCDDDLQRASFTLAYEIDAALKADRARLERAALSCAAASIGVVVTIDECDDVVFRYDAFVDRDYTLNDALARILTELERAQERFFAGLA